MEQMQVVIPMSGLGVRFKVAGYTDPKPLLDVGGRPLIAHLMDRFPPQWRFVFVCNEDHLRETRLGDVLRGLAPHGEIVAIAPHKRGPVHALLEASDSIIEDMPTIANYCDFSFYWDPAHFAEWTRRTRCDGAVVCYRGFHPHHLGKTLYAYCRDDGGRILEVKEKGHFTSDRTQEFASSGTYYFASGALMKRYCQAVVDQGLHVNGEYYVSLVYNPMSRDGLTSLVYEIPYFLQWGTPEDLQDYGYWRAAFTELSRRRPVSRGPRLLMPMAGLGSRFAEGAMPKPLIEVGGRPMFLAARDRIPCRKEGAVLVLRREIADDVRALDSGADVVVLDAPTQGQADSTLRGLIRLDPEEPVLVSSCDHGLLWDSDAWDDLLARGPDVVVVGQRGYPGARRKPASFAYILADAGRVSGVSVKVPLSSHPESDLLLVGTFYFKSARLLQSLIEDLLRRDIRVNGERYLDSVVQICVERRLDVRCFESLAYLNWGSPEALQEYSYWHGYFVGIRA